MNPLMILGKGISLLMMGYDALKSFPFLWKLVRNYGSIKQILVDAWSVIESARAHGGLPTCEETRKLIGIARIIFEKELIDLPEVNELKFAEDLREVEHALTCTIGEQRKRDGDQP